MKVLSVIAQCVAVAGMLGLIVIGLTLMALVYARIGWVF